MVYDDFANGDLSMKNGGASPSETSWFLRYDGDRMENNLDELPSGYVKIAIENGHRNSGFSHQTR